MSEALLSLLAILAFALVVLLVVVWRFPKQFASLFSRMEKFEAGSSGVSISFATDQLKKAAEQKGVRVGDTVISPTVDWKGKSILWVDDRHDNNFHEAAMFEALGADIRFARNNAEAVDAIGDATPTVVISDIGRAPSSELGLELPDAVSAASLDLPPLVYYVGQADAPTTPRGHIVVDRPDALYREVAGIFAKG